MKCLLLSLIAVAACARTAPVVEHPTAPHRTIELRSLCSDAETRSMCTPATGEAPKPVFAGIRGGVGRLPGAVAAEAARRGADMRTGTSARSLRRTGSGWRAELSDGTFVDCDLVVLAVPAYAARDLLAGPAPSAAAELAEIEYASMAITTFAFHRSAFNDVPPGSGFLVPPADGRSIKAATFSSVKWPWLGHGAGDRGNAVALHTGRVFVRGPARPAAGRAGRPQGQADPVRSGAAGRGPADRRPA